MATVQARTDEHLKKQVQKILKELGMDLSTAINLYLTQIAITESIPFPIRTVNGFTPEQEQTIIREEKEAMKNGKRYHSADALFRDMLGAWPPKKTHRKRTRS